MSEKHGGKRNTSNTDSDLSEKTASVKAWYGKLEKELLALLDHPLVPQAFKKLFQEGN